ncbi:MAG: hypothetical protein ACJ72N_22040 [Labedaea sp.]
MPSPKTIAWIVGLSLLTTIGLERYRAQKGAGPGAASAMRRVA